MNSFVEKIFVGREDTLARLESAYKTNRPRMIVIKGRRRVGKSELVKQFAKDKPFLFFSAEPPTPSDSMQTKLVEFRAQLIEQIKPTEPVPVFEDWFWAFVYLKKFLHQGLVILFDEISWMSHGTDRLPGLLKNWWDEIDHANRHITLFICGSVSTWIEKNLIRSTALIGRLSERFSLKPLSIPESVRLLKNIGFDASPYEFFKLLSVFGGIPWYLRMIQPDERVSDFIKRSCFLSEGLLIDEFKIIFHDLFNGETLIYRHILEALEAGGRSVAEIRKAINYQDEEKIPLITLLENLEIAGFVWGYDLWNLSSATQSTKFIYFIIDPFTRFYLKSIAPVEQQIRRGFYDNLSSSEIAGLSPRFGFQLETLLIQNRETVIKAMGLSLSNVAYDGPYRQFKTAAQKGCQIDYLIQTKDKVIFLCEFKFMHDPLGPSIVFEVQEKVERFIVPDGFKVLPVLFHIGGVTDSVVEKKFFYRIVNLGDIIKNIK